MFQGILSYLAVDYSPKLYFTELTEDSLSAKMHLSGLFAFLKQIF